MIYDYADRRFEATGSFYIAPSADVIGSVRLGHQASVWFNAVLRGDDDWIIVGDGSNVQDGTIRASRWSLAITSPLAMA